MLDKLKLSMVLDESKTISEEALHTICESYEDDELLEDVLEVDQKVNTGEDDAELEELIENIPEDDELQEELLEAQNLYIENFLSEEEGCSPCAAKGSDGNSDDLAEDMDLDIL